MTTDKKKRAVLISLEDEGDQLRLRLDDIVKMDDPLVWKQDVHYTSKLYQKDNLENLEFDEKDLADFGYSIWARLYAFMKQGEM